MKNKEVIPGIERPLKFLETPDLLKGLERKENPTYLEDLETYAKRLEWRIKNLTKPK